MLVIGLATAALTSPSSASLSDDIDRASEDPDRTEAQTEVDTSTASINELTELLKNLNAEVNEAEAAKTRIEAEREALEDQAGGYGLEIEALQIEIETLEMELAALAIGAFQEGGNVSAFTESDPTDVLRRNGLLNSVVANEREKAEELRLAKAELATQEARQDDIAERLDLESEEIDRSLEKFEGARRALVDVAQEAEQRADRALFEAEGLQAVDPSTADELRASVEALNQQLSIALADQLEKDVAEAAANPTAAYVPDGTFPTDDQIVDAGNGIRVHVDIVDQVQLMIQAAEADGVTLQSINGSGGYRSNARQIELRRQHCGPTDFDIYQKSSSLCRPPTATPGNSLHEQGKAIDFSNSAGAIRRGGPEFVWLSQNAATFGFFNLPSESWHWSVNGN